jgi:hypothetical protein
MWSDVGRYCGNFVPIREVYEEDMNIWKMQNYSLKFKIFLNFIFSLALVFFSFNFTSAAESVKYEVQRFESYNITLDASIKGEVKDAEHTAGEDISAVVSITNDGGYCLSDGILVYDLVKGRDTPVSIPFSSRDVIDGENFFQEDSLDVSICPGEVKTIPLNITLPEDLSSGQYRLDLYLKAPRLSINGNHEAYAPITSIPFKVQGGGDFPQARIVHSKTVFAGGQYQSGPVVDPGGSQSVFVTVQNNSSEKFQGVVEVSICPFGDASGLGCKPDGKYDINIEANKEISVGFDASTDIKADVYAVLYKLLDKEGRLVSIYKNRFIVGGHKASLRYLSADKASYKEGEKVGLHGSVNGPYTYGMVGGMTEDLDLKVDVYDTGGLWEKNIYSNTQHYPSINSDSEAPFVADFTAGADISGYKMCGRVLVAGKEVDLRCISSGESKYYLSWPWSYLPIVILILAIASVLFKYFSRGAGLARGKNKTSFLIIATSLVLSGYIILGYRSEVSARDYQIAPNSQSYNISSNVPEGPNCAFMVAHYGFGNNNSDDSTIQKFAFNTNTALQSRVRFLKGRGDNLFYVPKGTIIHPYRPMLDDPTKIVPTTITLTGDHLENGFPINYTITKTISSPAPGYENCMVPFGTYSCANGVTFPNSVTAPDYRIYISDGGDFTFNESSTVKISSVSPAALISAINENTYSDPSYSQRTKIFPGLDTLDVTPNMISVLTNGGTITNANGVSVTVNPNDVGLLDSYFGADQLTTAPSPHPFVAAAILKNYKSRCESTNPQASAGNGNEEIKLASAAVLPEPSRELNIFGKIGEFGIVNTSSVFDAIKSLFELSTANAATTCVAPPANLVSWLPGDGNTNDKKGLNNGTVFGGVTFATGKVDQAFNLNGAVGSYVAVPNTTDLQFTTGGTIEGWIKTTNAGTGFRGIMVKQHAYGLYLIDNVLGTYDFGASTPRSTGVSLNVPNPSNGDTWRHVAMTFQSGVPNGTIIYIDGVARLTTTITVKSTPTANFAIGSGVPDGTSQNFAGMIDEVSVYNRVLTAGEISAIFNADNFGKCKVLNITTSTLQDSFVNTSVSDQITAISGTAPITFSLQSGTLPTGLSLSTSGLISGTPTVAGTYNFTIKAIDATGTTATKALTKIILPPLTCTNLPNNLISWWSGEGDGGDLMGFNNGTANGTVAYDTNGKVIKAFKFNGTNSYISVPASSGSLNLTGTAVTIEGWVNPGVASNTGILFGKTVSGGNDYLLHLSGGVLNFIVKAGGSELGAATTYSPPVNQFTHLALIYDGSTVKIYANGTQIYSGAKTGNLAGSNAPFTIGGRSGGPFFNGLIDEVSIYNRALSQSEIQAVVNASSAGRCKTMVISNASLPDVIIGDTASDQLSTAFATAPVTFSLQSGTLPTGLSLSTPGLISGTPTAANTYNFTIKATDATGVTATKALTKIILPPPPCVAPSANLVSWWPGDGDATDYQDLNPGTLKNGVLFASGRVGQAFNLDGVNDYVDAGNPTNLQLPNTGTISSWVYMDAANKVGLQGIIVKQGAYGFFLNGGALATYDWSLNSLRSTGIDLADSKWHHVAMTFWSGGSTATFYIDGVSKLTIGYNIRPASSGSQNKPLLIGTGDPGLQFFKGLIDEADVYNSVLTAAEIKAIFDAGSSGKCKPLGIITTSIPDGEVNISVSDQINKKGGTAPITFSLQSGTLPTGLSLSTAGLISGTPTVAGTYNFTIKAIDATGTTATKALTKIILPPPVCVVPPANLVNWWPGEGDAKDIKGVSHGTLTNGALATATGKVEKSLSFDGVDDFVKLPDNFFPFPASGATSNAASSFDLWFKTASGGVILAQQDTDNVLIPNSNVPAIYVGTDGKLRAEVFWNGSIAPITSSGVVTDGLFHHLAVTYDGTTQRMYLDSTLLGSAPHTQRGFTGVYRYQLGRGWTASWPGGNGGWYPFNGLIDEVSTYNRTLTQGEVNAIYGARSAGKCKPLITAPTFTAVGGDRNVTLSITAPSSDVVHPSATSYKIYKGATGFVPNDATNLVATVNGASYTDSGLTNGTTYYYKIKAVNSSGDSPVSGEVSAKPILPCVASNPDTSSAARTIITVNGKTYYINLEGVKALLREYGYVSTVVTSTMTPVNSNTKILANGVLRYQFLQSGVYNIKLGRSPTPTPNFRDKRYLLGDYIDGYQGQN